MDGSLDVIAFEPISDSPQPNCELPQADTQQPACEVGATSQQSAQMPWKPTEAQFCRVIAEHLQVTKKTVQQWFGKVVEAHPWIPQTELRLADERYSPRCIELMGQYQSAVKRGLKFDSWKLEVQDLYSEDYRVYLASQQTQPHPPAFPDRSHSLTLPASDIPVVDADLVDSDAILDELASQRSNTATALSHRQQRTEAISGKNSNQIERLRQLLMERQQQQHQERKDKVEQWEVEVTRETLDEFLYKQKRRDELLTQLEQLDNVGKPQVETAGATS